MTRLQKLIDKRVKAVAQARAIHEAASAANRAMTKDEETRWNAFLKEAEEANKEVEQETRMLDAEAREILRERGGTPETPEELEERRASLGDPNYRRNGSRAHVMINDEIRAYRHNEPMHGSVETAPLPDGIQLEDLSLSRMLRGKVLGDWHGADAELRAMSGLSGTEGGFLIPDPLSLRIIDLARNQAILSQAGALTVPMDKRRMLIAKITQDPTAHWRKEHQTIDESDAAFGGLELQLQTLACLVRVSIELLEDGENFGRMIENQIASALALELDRAGLLGSGVGEPLGLFNWPGLQEISMGANAGTPTNFDQWSQAVENLMAVNAAPTTAIMAPRTWGTLDRLVDGTGVPLQAPESYKSLRKLTSNQIPIDQTQGSSSAASFSIVGGFENVVIGMRKGIVIEAFRQETDAVKKMQVVIRGYLRADIGVIRDTHLVKITGITA